ncbi:UPF0236 family protein [Terrilactibacillus sp. S3-3]|nr:UPF0236 family protein [Terrilactibacillus sp. S3-3]
MDIIKDLFDIWKRKRNLVDFETGAVQVMYEWMGQAVGRMLTEMNRALTRLKQNEGWKVERTDERRLQFLFGPVTFSHTLMIAPNHQRLYPLDRLMKWRKGSRYSPYVELKAAELAGRISLSSSGGNLGDVDTDQDESQHGHGQRPPSGSGSRSNG